MRDGADARLKGLGASLLTVSPIELLSVTTDTRRILLTSRYQHARLLSSFTKECCQALLDNPSPELVEPEPRAKTKAFRPTTQSYNSVYFLTRPISHDSLGSELWLYLCRAKDCWCL